MGSILSSLNGVGIVMLVLIALVIPFLKAFVLSRKDTNGSCSGWVNISKL